MDDSINLPKVLTYKFFMTYKLEIRNEIFSGLVDLKLAIQNVALKKQSSQNWVSKVHFVSQIIFLVLIKVFFVFWIIAYWTEYLELYFLVWKFKWPVSICFGKNDTSGHIFSCFTCVSDFHKELEFHNFCINECWAFLRQLLTKVVKTASLSRRTVTTVQMIAYQVR